MAGERKSYNTTLRTDLTMRLRILAAQQGKRQNDLLEEAIQTLLQKYKENSPSTKKSLAPKQEKRVYPRTKVSWPVSIISTKGLTKGAIKNISKGGALIRCRELPKTDESLALSLEFTDHLLIVSAIVEKVRLNLDDSDTASPSYDLAVRFLGIDVDQRRHLYNALEN